MTPKQVEKRLKKVIPVLGQNTITLTPVAWTNVPRGMAEGPQDRVGSGVVE